MTNGNRAQISLIFYDDDLFKNFITPLRKNRELSDLIIKCLTKYYYDENVRNLIENVDTNEEDDAMKSINDEINNIQANIALMGFSIDEAIMELENGSNDIREAMDNALNNDKYKEFFSYDEDDKSKNPKVDLDKIKEYNEEKIDKAIKVIEMQKGGENAQQSDISNAQIYTVLNKTMLAIIEIYSRLGVSNSPYSNEDFSIIGSPINNRQNVQNFNPNFRFYDDNIANDFDDGRVRNPQMPNQQNIMAPNIQNQQQRNQMNYGQQPIQYQQPVINMQNIPQEPVNIFNRNEPTQNTFVNSQNNFANQQENVNKAENKVENKVETNGVVNTESVSLEKNEVINTESDSSNTNKVDVSNTKTISNESIIEDEDDRNEKLLELYNSAMR